MKTIIVLLSVAVLAAFCAEGVTLTKVHSAIAAKATVQLSQNELFQMMTTDIYDEQLKAASLGKDEATVRNYLRTRLALFDAAVGWTANTMNQQVWETMRDILVREVCVAFSYDTVTDWKVKLGQLFMLPGVHAAKNGAMGAAYNDDALLKAYNAERSAVIFDSDKLDDNIAKLYTALAEPAAGAKNKDYNVRALLHLMDRSAAYGEAKVFQAAVACDNAFDQDKKVTNTCKQSLPVNCDDKGKCTFDSTKVAKSSGALDRFGASFLTEAPGSLRHHLWRLWRDQQSTDTKVVGAAQAIVKKCRINYGHVDTQFRRVMEQVATTGKALKKHIFTNKETHALQYYCARNNLCFFPNGTDHFTPDYPFRKMNKGVETVTKLTSESLAKFNMADLSADELKYMNTLGLYTSRVVTVTEDKDKKKTCGDTCKKGNLVNEDACKADDKGNLKDCFEAKFLGGSQNYFFKDVTIDDKANKNKPLKWTTGGSVFMMDQKEVNADSKRWQGFTLPHALAAGPSGTTDEYFQAADLMGVGRVPFTNCLVRNAAFGNMILQNHHTFPEIMQGAWDPIRDDMPKWQEDLTSASAPGHQHVTDYLKCDEAFKTKEVPDRTPFDWDGKKAPTFPNNGKKFSLPADAAKGALRTAMLAKLDELTKAAEKKDDLWSVFTTATDFGTANFPKDWNVFTIGDNLKKAFCPQLKNEEEKLVFCPASAAAPAAASATSASATPAKPASTSATPAKPASASATPAKPGKF